MITIEFPVKPYIGHFLRTRFGNPCHLTLDSQIGKLFYLLVKEETKSKSVSQKKVTYKHSLQVKITENVFRRRGHVLSRNSVATFNNFMAEYIKEKMFLYSDALLEANQELKIKAALEMSLEKFQFNQDVFPYETLKKSYDRYRCGLKKHATN